MISNKFSTSGRSVVNWLSWKVSHKALAEKIDNRVDSADISGRMASTDGKH